MLDPDKLQWQRLWLVWGAGPTIASGDDEFVASMLRRYPHRQLFNVDDVYPGQEWQTGGVWLMTNDTLSR
jgi:hypothetical protein